MSWLLTPPPFPELTGSFLVNLLDTFRLLSEVSTDEATSASYLTKTEAKQKTKEKKTLVQLNEREENHQFTFLALAFTMSEEEDECLTFRQSKKAITL